MWEKEKASFGVLILTINNNIERVKRDLLPQLSKVEEIVISHQIFDNKTKPSKFTDKRIKYIVSYEPGVAKNRNIAIKESTSDIVHICWDDISYVDWFQKKILSTYKDTPNMWIISFQAQDPDSGENIINVWKWRHNFRTILSTKSCGMTYNMKVLKTLWLIFDERFGLGTQHPTWEETIYFSDFLKSWWKARHVDAPIVYHSRDTSGSNFSNTELIGSRIQVFHRMFWFLGAVFAWVYLWIRDYKSYKQHISLSTYISLNISNIFYKKY